MLCWPSKLVIEAAAADESLLCEISGFAGAGGSVSAFGADGVLVASGQTQVQFQFQLQLQACWYVQLVVQSPRVHVQVHVHIPGVPVCTVAVSFVAGAATGAAPAGAVQFQTQSGVEVGADSGEGGAEPVVQFQFQFHGVVESVGITMLSGAPGTTIPTTRLSGWVTVVTEVTAEASAPFSCVTRPSVPGLATRIETLTLLGDCCTAVAVE
jgi:hypothetical protein